MSKINLLPGEKLKQISNKSDNSMDDKEINIKYEVGENRIITEQGSYKLPMLKSIFITKKNYKLQPDYQRRITWDNKKRSKLIESFIINIPIPPIFIYEHEFDNYEVMDGLQRISAIINFYDDGFALEGLEEWPELNGRTYSQLPEKIREGIDRRQLSAVTLLKESAKDKAVSEKIKKMVFQRLNTGGMKLEDQEVRNALYDGPFNKLCYDLSFNETFKKLWGINLNTLHPDKADETDDTELETAEDSVIYINDKLYKRMYDVELVLRFFAMRHLDQYNTNLTNLLDICLISGNEYECNTLNELSNIFINTIDIAYKLFSDKAFCYYKLYNKKYVWTKPQKKIYDPIMLAISQKLDKLSTITINVEKNVKLLEEMYKSNEKEFYGKIQTKNTIETRYKIIEKLLNKIINGK